MAAAATTRWAAADFVMNTGSSSSKHEVHSLISFLFFWAPLAQLGAVMFHQWQAAAHGQQVASNIFGRLSILGRWGPLTRRQRGLVS